MSNPTTPFSWQMPTNTDLVTDLPADFEVFGQAVATSLADLLGGTTGQVLAKATNSNMDFVWTDANPGDITGVTAGTGISGGGTSGTVTVTNSMATAIDAKGDLIAGTAADAFSRIAVGTNGQVLTADSTAATGVAWATPSSGSTLVGCAAYRASGNNMSIPNSTVTALTLPSEEWDTDGFHSTTTNTSRFTIPAGKAGKYNINAGMGYSANAGSLQQMRLYVNGSVYNTNGYSGGGLIADQRYTSDNVWGYSAVLSLAVGDYLEIYALHNAASAVNTDGIRIVITYLGA